MEEKERYELIGYCSYRDTETGVIGDNFVELLNQQDKKIIKLKEENQQLRQQLAEMQNEKAIRELEKVKWFLLEKIEEKQSCFDSGNYNDFADGVKTICELMLISIDKQIKELGGVENVF